MLPDDGLVSLLGDFSIEKDSEDEHNGIGENFCGIGEDDGPDAI